MGVVNGNQSFVFSGAYLEDTRQLSHPPYLEKDETRNPKGTGEDSFRQISALY